MYYQDYRKLDCGLCYKFGVYEQTVSRWQKELRDSGDIESCGYLVTMILMKQKKSHDENKNYEMHRMRLKYKKSNQHSGKMTEAIYFEVTEMVEIAHKAKCRVSVSRMLKHLGVFRSAYHAWLKRVPSKYRKKM